MPELTTNLNQHFANQTFDIKKLLAEFKKPILENVFYNNIQYLVERSSFINFNKEKWILRPYNFCRDYYSEPYFYPVILLVNNLGSVYHFRPEKFTNEIIIAPNKDAIIEVLSKRIS